MTERTAYDWIDDIERMQGGPNGPTIRLRACVLEIEQGAFALAAGQCANVVGDEGGTPQCKRIAELSAGLADACELLQGWIAEKCPPRYRSEHLAHVEKLRGLLGPNAMFSRSQRPANL
jgi:hypothetical protein